MGNKTKRLLIIRKLIDNEQISSQEELLYRLKQEGVEATQSTLSRDLKFMRVAKIPHKDKGYIYIIPDNMQSEPSDEKASTIVRHHWRRRHDPRRYAGRSKSKRIAGYSIFHSSQYPFIV